MSSSTRDLDIPVATGVKYATTNGRNFSNDGARQALARMSDTERKLFQDGFVSAYIQRIRSMPYRSSVSAKIMNSPSAVEQMEIALGPQRAKELQAFTHTENLMDLARKSDQGNSTTARQLIEATLAGGASDTLFGSGNPFADPASFLVHATVYGALRHGGGLAAARNRPKCRQPSSQVTNVGRPIAHRSGVEDDRAKTPALRRRQQCGCCFGCDSRSRG